MSYGLTAINSAGFAQIDSQYSNYVAVQSGTVSITAAQRTLTVSYADRGIVPIIAIRTLGGAAVTYDSITRTAIVFDRGEVAGSLATTSSFEYIVYVPSSNASVPTNDYGLAVRSSSGNVVFTTQYRYKRLAATRVFGHNNSSNFNHNLGHQYVVINGSPLLMRLFYSNSFGGPAAAVVLALRSENNRIVADPVFYYLGPSDGDGYWIYYDWVFNSGVVLG